jgi:hypothetical protein
MAKEGGGHKGSSPYSWKPWEYRQGRTHGNHWSTGKAALMETIGVQARPPAPEKGIHPRTNRPWNSMKRINTRVLECAYREKIERKKLTPFGRYIIY